MHEVLSDRGLVYLEACLLTGIVLIITHMLMKIRMTVSARPGQWLLDMHDDRRTIVRYAEQARDREWGLWPLWIYRGALVAMLFTASMVLVNELLLKKPHYPEAEFQQVYVRWRAKRNAKGSASPANSQLVATPAQAVEQPVTPTQEAKSDVKPEGKSADPKTSKVKEEK